MYLQPLARIPSDSPRFSFTHATQTFWIKRPGRQRCVHLGVTTRGEWAVIEEQLSLLRVRRAVHYLGQSEEMARRFAREVINRRCMYGPWTAPDDMNSQIDEIMSQAA